MSSIADQYPKHTAATEPAPVEVVLPAALINLFPDADRRPRIAGATVAEIIDGLDTRWPGMGDRLRDSRPAIRRHINVFVGNTRATLATPVPPDARVFILTAISGG